MRCREKETRRRNKKLLLATIESLHNLNLFIHGKLNMTRKILIKR